MTVEGLTQGAIAGPVLQVGREESFLVQEVNHLIEIPYSSQTGLATGKRIHHPFEVTVELGLGGPMLHLAQTTHEHLNVDFKWYRPHPEGGAAEQHYYTTKLIKAVLVKIGTENPNVLDPANKPFTHQHKLSFTYERIEWTYEPDGQSATDDWQQPSTA
jgi:type VI secretion system secreted protein Hcp